jgi:ABC-type cobalamin/Fe3+-siderophores transport system ATPase subunit
MTQDTTVLFKNLSLAGWRQFEAIDIELHPRLTIITGANGSGKTTLLNIFSRHFGWNPQYLATPIKNKGDGAYSYLTGIYQSVRKAIAEVNPGHVEVGTLHYTNGATASLQVPDKTNVQYNLQANNQQNVPGVGIASHRLLTHYQQVGHIPTQVMLPEQAYGTYNSETINRYQGGHTQFSPTYRIKEALISMATFGAGNDYVQRNQEVLNTYLGFIDVLRKVLPKDIGFLDISIRTPDVVLVTKSGEFLFDAASGGIMALVDLAWRIFLYSRRKTPFAVAIDEPENHLHPSMQRSLMGSLVRAFPNAQFIVATHSPFIVSSVRDSSVYVLNYNESNQEQGDSIDGELKLRRIVSLKLDTVNRAGSAGEILREVLGVRATVPEWVEENLAQIVEKYRGQQITSGTLSALRSELSGLGYGQLYPDALASLTEGK